MEKMAAHTPHLVPHPSTSTVVTPSLPLFNPQQLLHNSPAQIVNNTIFSANPFLNINPAAFPLSAFSDFSRLQHWFQNGSPYASPCPSNTPSLVSNISGLSLFAGAGSNLSLNGQPNSNVLAATTKLQEFMDVGEPTPKKECNQAQQYLKLLIDMIKDTTKPDVTFCMRFLGTLRIFVDKVESKSLPGECNPTDFNEIIRLTIERILQTEDQKALKEMVEIFEKASSIPQFNQVIRESPIQTLQPFIDLIGRIAPLTVEKSFVDVKTGQFGTLNSLLRILYNNLSKLRDKSSLRTEKFFTLALELLRLGSPNTKFFVLGILRILLYGAEEWKKFVFQRNGVELMLDIVRGNCHHRLFRHTIRTFNVLLDSSDSRFADRFVQLGGIDIALVNCHLLATAGEEDLSVLLHCLRLVSDLPVLAKLDLARAIHFAIRGTIPRKVSENSTRNSKTNTTILLRNIANSLGFLRNALAINTHGRAYMISIENGRAIQHLVELASQCIQCLEMPQMEDRVPAHDRNNLTNNSSKGFIDEKKRDLVKSILEDCLAILSLLNKEGVKNGLNTAEQQNASRMLANNEAAMVVFQLVLKMDEPALQRSVLMSLRRMLQCNIVPPTANRGIRLAETLLRFLFAIDPSSEKSPLMKLAADVLCRLAAEPGRQHLSVISSLISTEFFQPFELLAQSNINMELYMSILRLIKELCQREPILRSHWSQSNTLDMLNLIKTTSSHPEIANLCAKLIELLQMGNLQDTSESTFFDYFMDQTGLS